MNSLTEDQLEKINTLISLWSMRPSPMSRIGQGWEAGARAGYEAALKGEVLPVRDITSAPQDIHPDAQQHYVNYWNKGADQGYTWGVRVWSDKPPFRTMSGAENKKLFEVIARREREELVDTAAPDPVLKAVEQYREAKETLRKLRDDRFKVGDPVRVAAPQYHGCGRVSFGDDQLTTDRLPVLLENGNTWYYPLELCYPCAEDAHPTLARIPHYGKR